MNAGKMMYMCFDQKRDIFIFNGGPLKLRNKFTNLGSNFSTTVSDISMRLAKALIAIERLSMIWKSDLPDIIKRNFFQAVIVSIRLYG